MERKPQRGGCLGLWLAWVLIVGLGTVAARVSGQSVRLPTLSAPSLYVSVGLMASFAIWAVGLWYWRKWALWGYVATCVGLGVFEFCAMEQPPLFAAKWLLLIGVLALLLKPRWEYMRHREQKAPVPADDQPGTGKSLLLRAWGRRYEFGALVCYFIWGASVALCPPGATSLLQAPPPRTPVPGIHLEPPVAPEFEGPYLAANLAEMVHERDGIRFSMRLAPAGGQAAVYVSRGGLRRTLASLSLTTMDGEPVQMSQEIAWSRTPGPPEFDLEFVPSEGLDLTVKRLGDWRVGVPTTRARLRSIRDGTRLRYELDGMLRCSRDPNGRTPHDVRVWGAGALVYRR